MAAPIGNKFWELRSKHGRDKLFATPELMWQAACEYFEWCQENPLIEIKPMTVNIGDYMSRIENAEIPKMRPFTWQGLCIYLDCNTLYFNQFEKSLEGKDDKLSEDFSKTISRIRDVLYNQKFTGAAAGFLNPNIIAMELGMKSKTEVDITTDRPDITNLFKNIEGGE